MSDHSSTSKSVSRLLALISLPFLALITLLTVAGLDHEQGSSTPVKVHQVNVIPVNLQDSFQHQRHAYGRVEASQLTQAGFELSGLVTELLVDEGETVKPGQLLAQLDTQRLKARLQEVAATLARAEADARLAKLSQRRVNELVAKQLESAQRLDELREATLAAEALVTEIKARRDTLLVELTKSQLRAPFAANVIDRKVDQGAVVNAGQSVLVLQKASNLEVRFALPANDAFKFKPGENYTLKLNDISYTASIKSIASQRQLATRTIDVVFTIKNQRTALLPGDLLLLSYPVTVEKSGMWVPKIALNTGIRGLWTLYSVPQTGQHSLQQKSVEILYFDSARAFVRGALKSSDFIVVNGHQRLVAEQQVIAAEIESSLSGSYPTPKVYVPEQ